jgi:hypothetical protein
MSNVQLAHIGHGIVTRELTLGDCFVLELFKVPRGRGLTAAYERIQSVVGDLYGSRNTFAKLQYARSFSDLNRKDQLRAWMLMAVLGMDPYEYGGGDAVVPPTMDIAKLRRDLRMVGPAGIEPTTSTV